MPRLSPELLLRAHRQHPLLPLLLRECRDLPSARNELRWLRSHALAQFSNPRFKHEKQTAHSPETLGWRTRLRAMCQARAKGKPLQYILGDQPFGDLEILCREGVLIPRSETETYTIRASRLILKHLRGQSRPRPSSSGPLRILDLCTGTGCIPLLLHQLLSSHVPQLEIVGIDISQKAVTLARKNLEYNTQLGLLPKRARSEIRFVKGNVLDMSLDSASLGDIFDRGKPTAQCRDQEGKANAPKSTINGGSWDVLISNPPYISPLQFGNGTTARSVRFFEPKLALVPPTALTNCEKKLLETHQKLHVESDVISDTGFDAQADTFYPRLLSISSLLNAKLSIFECGDPQQAQRVEKLATRHHPTGKDVDLETGSKDREAGNEFKVEVWRCNDEFEHEDDDGYHSFSGNDPMQDDEGARAVVVKRRPFLF